jgi:hypothetical protein
LPIRDQVTLKSLAQQLGVSAMTVSNAFNRPEELSANLRQRILSTGANAGYHGPRPSGRMLRTGLAGAIALSNPDPIPHLFEDSNASAFMTGISEICEKHQYGLAVPGRFVDGLIVRLDNLHSARGGTSVFRIVLNNGGDIHEVEHQIVRRFWRAGQSS